MTSAVCSCSYMCMWEGETLCIFIVTVWANVSGGAPLTMIILTLNLSLATKVKMRFRGISQSYHGDVCLFCVHIC